MLTFFVHWTHLSVDVISLICIKKLTSCVTHECAPVHVHVCLCECEHACARTACLLTQVGAWCGVTHSPLKQVTGPTVYPHVPISAPRRML